MKCKYGAWAEWYLEQVNSLCIHSFFSLYVDINYQLLMMNYNFDSLLGLIVLSCLFLVMFSSAVNMSFLMTHIAVILYLAYS